MTHVLAVLVILITNINHVLQIINQALQKVFFSKCYLLISFFAALVMFTILTLLPVGKFNERTFYYQVTSLDTISLFVMVLFSCMFGILLSMNLHLFKLTHESKKQTLGHSFISIFSSFIAGMFGSAVCPACVALIFGFLGLPTMAFLLSYQKEFFILSSFISFYSIYLSAKAINSHNMCKKCIL